MTAEFPMVSEFGPATPACDGRANGSAVATTAAILRRYRPATDVPPLKALGISMGGRHRAADPMSRHGQCPNPWCPYCSYLELKANHVGVGYGRLSIAQLRAHAQARHAIHLPGWYAEIHLVSASSYSATVAATGRSDDSQGGRFRHSITVWAVGRTARSGRPADSVPGVF